MCILILRSGLEVAAHYSVGDMDWVARHLLGWPPWLKEQKEVARTPSPPPKAPAPQPKKVRFAV